MIIGCVWDSNNKIKPTLYIILMALKQIKTVRSFHHRAPLSSLAAVCVGWVQTACILSLPSHRCLDIWCYDFKILKKQNITKKANYLNLSSNLNLCWLVVLVYWWISFTSVQSWSGLSAAATWCHGNTHNDSSFSFLLFAYQNFSALIWKSGSLEFSSSETRLLRPRPLSDWWGSCPLEVRRWGLLIFGAFLS